MKKFKTMCVVFQDNKGYICAVRDCIKEKDAYELARNELKQFVPTLEKIAKVYEYNHMYYGYGNSDGESESTWWLVDNSVKNGIPVQCFRPIII